MSPEPRSTRGPVSSVHSTPTKSCRGQSTFPYTYPTVPDTCDTTFLSYSRGPVRLVPLPHGRPVVPPAYTYTLPFAVFRRRSSSRPSFTSLSLTVPGGRRLEVVGPLTSLSVTSVGLFLLYGQGIFAYTKEPYRGPRNSTFRLTVRSVEPRPHLHLLPCKGWVSEYLDTVSCLCRRFSIYLLCPTSRSGVGRRLYVGPVVLWTFRGGGTDSDRSL